MAIKAHNVNGKLHIFRCALLRPMHNKMLSYRRETALEVH